MLNTVVMSVDNMWTDPLALDILTLYLLLIIIKD